MARFGSKTQEHSAEPDVTGEYTEQDREAAAFMGGELTETGLVTHHDATSAYPDAAITESAEKPKKAYTKIDDAPASSLVSEDVSDDELVPFRSRERTPEQQIVDADVVQLHNTWVERGRPSLSGSPAKRYIVPPEHVAGVRKMLQRADRFVDVHVKIAPTVDHISGGKIVQFTARDRTARDRTAKPQRNAPGVNV